MTNAVKPKGTYTKMTKPHDKHMTISCGYVLLLWLVVDIVMVGC